MTRFVAVERKFMQYDLFIYSGPKEIAIKGIQYFEMVARIDMRIKAGDAIVHLPLDHFPYIQTGAEYIRMRDGK